MVIPPSIGDLLMLWGLLRLFALQSGFHLESPLLYAPRLRILFAPSLI